MRQIAAPFVVAPPAGRRIRTRLRTSPREERALFALGEHLGALAGRDLSERCRAGKGGSDRTRRKRKLTAECSSRWAGAITRTSNDQWRRAYLNLLGERRSRRRALAVLDRRLAAPVGGRAANGVHGYVSAAERFHKQRRRQALAARLREVEARISEGRVSIVRGGRRLANTRHHLQEAGLNSDEWRERWLVARLQITADGEADKRHGNETIRVDPATGVVDIKLPAALAEHANAPHSRLRLGTPVTFAHRGREWAVQVESGAVRYDITYDAIRRRWYLDASWQLAASDPTPAEHAAGEAVIAVDLNDAQLDAIRLDSSGNPLGRPLTISIASEGAASRRDASLRHAITTLIGHAKRAGVRVIAVEDLNFADVRSSGRETLGRGPRGKRMRRTVAGLPTARFRDRLVQMCSNQGLHVIAVDPAYTSKWGRRYWQAALSTKDFDASRHHAASVVIGRRAQRYRARRGRRCDSRPTGGSGRESYPGQTPPPLRASAPDRDGEADAQHHRVRRTRTGEPTAIRGSPPDTVRGGRRDYRSLVPGR